MCILASKRSEISWWRDTIYNDRWVQTTGVSPIYSFEFRNNHNDGDDDVKHGDDIYSVLYTRLIFSFFFLEIDSDRERERGKERARARREREKSQLRLILFLSLAERANDEEKRRSVFTLKSNITQQAAVFSFYILQHFSKRMLLLVE